MTDRFDSEEEKRFFGLRPAQIAVRTLLLLTGVLIVLAGWRLFWFLTDDAFIAFRYASNVLAGHGLVWNPPPFQPVEGYTSFLWVALLSAIWWLTGWAPPETSNVLSLGFGFATLALGYRMLQLLPLPVRLESHRLLLATVALAGVVSNRTFLAWLSSGLETAMVNFFLTWWLFAGWKLGRRPDSSPGLLSLSLATAGLALARPDGLLFLGATLGLITVRLLSGTTGTVSIRRYLLPAMPLLAVPAHLLFRRSIYGEWLPNTYYAKHVSAWPESGLRYLAAFVLEYGLWLWALLALIALVRWLPGGPRLVALLREPATWSRLIVLAALLAHCSYYTLVIGGDHFEFRIYSHLILLFFISAVSLVARIAPARPWAAVAWLAAFVLLSWPIPWTHWRATRHLTTRTDTHVLIQPVAERFPAWARPPVAAWDELQAWLIERHVGMRHQEHKVFFFFQSEIFPTREQGSRLHWEDRPVLAWKTPGVPGWALPEVAIIDLLGLNDRIIARSPPVEDDLRRMAHDRRAPPGYAECFRPSLTVERFGLLVSQREIPLIDDEILACENRPWL